MIDQYGNFDVTNTDTDILIIIDGDTDTNMLIIIDANAKTDIDQKKANSKIPIPI